MNELDAFLELTEQRLPTAEEIIGLCGALQIRFRVADGRPVISGGADTRPIREMVAKLIGREPWRSQVIERTGLLLDRKPYKLPEQPKNQSCSPHNNPVNFREETIDGIAKVFCRVCGKWIGNKRGD